MDRNQDKQHVLKGKTYRRNQGMYEHKHRIETQLGSMHVHLQVRNNKDGHIWISEAISINRIKGAHIGISI